jgi:hypothetical protein
MFEKGSLIPQAQRFTTVFFSERVSEFQQSKLRDVM